MKQPYVLTHQQYCSRTANSGYRPLVIVASLRIRTLRSWDVRYEAPTSSVLRPHQRGGGSARTGSRKRKQYWPAGSAVTAAMWDQWIVRQVAAPAVSADAPPTGFVNGMLSSRPIAKLNTASSRLLQLHYRNRSRSI